MKSHQLHISFLALLIVFAVLLGSSANASEVTGTLSTEPEASNTTNNTSLSTDVAPEEEEDTIVGTVTGGTPTAEENSAVSRDTLSTWIWIALPSLFIAGALVYVFSRAPSI